MINLSSNALIIKMGISKKVVCLIAVFILTLSSCSKVDDKIVKLLQKIVETSKEGLQETTLFTYRGNEIVNINGALKSTDFKYKDGLITRIVVLNKATKVVKTINYSYIKGKLVQVESLGNYIPKFNHNIDKTISYERFLLGANHQKIRDYHGILTFENGNYTNDIRTLDNVGFGIIMKSIRTFAYDKKINPFSVILGFDKIISYDVFMSINNNLSIVFIDSTTLPSDQVTSSATMSSTNFKYDADGYPIEKFSETALLPNGNMGYMKTEYFY
jgi:hypothetical protein